MNRLTGRNELILHQHSPRQPLGSFSGHPGGFRSYVVRACEVFWVFRVWELDLVNVCGEIPCNRRWLLKPSSSPPRWFFWPAETRTEDNVSVWTTGKERGSERSYKSHYNAEKPCTHPPPTPRHVCVWGVSLELSLHLCVRVYLQLLVRGEAELLQQHWDVGEVQTEERVCSCTSLHVLTHCTLNINSSFINTHFTF